MFHMGSDLVTDSRNLFLASMDPFAPQIGLFVAPIIGDANNFFSAQIKTHSRFEIIFVYHRASNSNFLQAENTNWSFLLKKKTEQRFC